MTKYKCLECGKVATEEERFDFFGLPACPSCLMIDNFTSACDVSWCEGAVSAGTPSPYGYLVLCLDHYRKLEAS